MFDQGQVGDTALSLLLYLTLPLSVHRRVSGRSATRDGTVRIQQWKPFHRCLGAGHEIWIWHSQVGKWRRVHGRVEREQNVLQTLRFPTLWVMLISTGLTQVGLRSVQILKRELVHGSIFLGQQAWPRYDLIYPRAGSGVSTSPLRDVNQPLQSCIFLLFEQPMLRESVAAGRFLWVVGDSYDGEWADDEMNGEGVMRYKNGNIYTGVLRRSVKHGTGKMTWASGDVYEGEWQEGLLHGRGVFKYADKGEYDGSAPRASACFKLSIPPLRLRRSRSSSCMAVATVEFYLRRLPTFSTPPPPAPLPNFPPKPL